MKSVHTHGSPVEYQEERTTGEKEHRNSPPGGITHPDERRRCWTFFNITTRTGCNQLQRLKSNRYTGYLRGE